MEACSAIHHHPPCNSFTASSYSLSVQSSSQLSIGLDDGEVSSVFSLQELFQKFLKLLRLPNFHEL